jgi:Lon protease-like protein
MIAEPCDFESAAWIANRIAEFMPIPAPAKHKLMILDEPVARLSIVHRWLQQHQVI